MVGIPREVGAVVVDGWMKDGNDEVTLKEKTVEGIEAVVREMRRENPPPVITS